MENKVKLREYLNATIIVGLILIIISILLNVYEYRTYTHNFNNKIDSIVTIVKNEYPNVTDKDIIQILNSDKKESTKNVSPLCDLRNIKVEYNSSNAFIVCDLKWQIEAITNILKNAIDHSKDNEKVLVTLEDNDVYSKIEIKDYGEGISKKDIKHIFERFYKGSNATADSIGIGLALSKSIIEEDNGNISVESDDTGTTFTIKYFKI